MVSIVGVSGGFVDKIAAGSAISLGLTFRLRRLRDGSIKPLLNPS